MKASNLQVGTIENTDVHLVLLPNLLVVICCFLTPCRGGASIPELGVESEAEAVPYSPRPALPLQRAGLGNKRLHQGAHLTAFMVPEQGDERDLHGGQGLVVAITGYYKAVSAHECVCVRACVRVCVRACMRACVCA